MRVRTAAGFLRIRLLWLFFLLLLPVVQLGLNLVNDLETLVELYGALPTAVNAVFEARPNLCGRKVRRMQLPRGRHPPRQHGERQDRHGHSHGEARLQNRMQNLAEPVLYTRGGRPGIGPRRPVLRSNRFDAQQQTGQRRFKIAITILDTGQWS